MSKISAGFGQLFSDMRNQFEEMSHDIFVWFKRAEDAERIIVMCVFILLLLVLFTHRDTDGQRGSGGIFRQFFGAFLFVCMFAFAAGWVMEARHEYGFLSWLT